jgi:hypothetical protein
MASPPAVTSKTKNKGSVCPVPLFVASELLLGKRFAHMPRTYTPATGFELILWTCHICFLGN